MPDCLQIARATRFEFHAPPLASPFKCELHTSPDDFHHTAVVNGCSCFAKVTVSAMPPDQHELIGRFAPLPASVRSNGDVGGGAVLDSGDHHA